MAEWICRIDPTAEADQDPVYRYPLALVEAARDAGVWPDQLRIALTDVPPADSREAELWGQACAECASHGTSVIMGDEVWDPARPFRPQWPAGNPMNWATNTPNARDVESGAFTVEVGALWQKRMRLADSWMVGVVYSADGTEIDPAVAGAVLKEVSGPQTVIVREGERRFWCAWPKGNKALTGAEWSRRVWAALGPVRVGTAMVTDRKAWEARIHRAISVAQTGPGGRVADLPVLGSPEQEAAARAEAERLREQEAQARAEASRARKEAAQKAAEKARAEAARQAAEQARAKAEAERIQAEKDVADRLAVERAKAEEARIRAERIREEQAQAARIQEEIAQAEAETARINAETARAKAAIEQEAARRAQVQLDAIEADRLHAERVAQERQEAEQATADRVAAERAVAERAEATRLEAEQAEAGLEPTVVEEPTPSETAPRRHLRPAMHWRPAQPSQWDRSTPDVPLPPRHAPSGAIPVVVPATHVEPVSPIESPSTPSPVTPPVRRRPALHVVAEPPVAMPEGLMLPWVAWVWGSARKAGTSSVALSLARWLAWNQTTPIRLLDGNFALPGLLGLIRTAKVQPGWGWEASWQAGTPSGAPPTVVSLADRLTVWAMGTPMNFVNAAKKWPQALKMMPDVAVIVDAGLAPPAVTADLMICVTPNGADVPQVPMNTWIAARGTHGSGAAHRITVPSEPLGIEGVGSAAWAEVWSPLQYLIRAAAQRTE